MPGPIVLTSRAKTYLAGSILALLATAYVVFCTYTPITLVGGSNLDDELFIAHARLLASGHWLGPFSQFTLMKGPGYSAFLALSAWSGLSVASSEAIFNCLAVGALAWVIWRLSHSAFAALAIFIVTLWNPGLLSLRVLRQAIYSAQTLMFMALIAYAFFGTRGRTRIIMMSLLAGLVLGWFWLTREEGAWIVPGVVLLVCGAMLRARVLEGSIRAPTIASASMLLAFSSVLLAFRLANLIAYGSFIGVDTQEPNFIGAVDALQSVEAGDPIPYVPVSAETRAAIYDVIPAFASLKPYLDPPGGSPFERPGCRWYPWACDEIAGGWFIWALRDAAASAGHYQSPADAAAFFHRLRDQVRTACAKHDLVCDPWPIPFMPRISSAQAWGIPGSFRRVLMNITFRWPPLLNQGPSSGRASDIFNDWMFLNQPVYMPTVERVPVGNLFVTYAGHASWVGLALRTRKFLIDAYGVIVPAIFWPGLAAMFIGLWSIGARRAAADPIIIMAAAAWTLLLTRVALIALIDASAFPAASWEYAAPAFPLACIAPLLSLAVLLNQPLLLTWPSRFRKRTVAPHEDNATMPAAE